MLTKTSAAMANVTKNRVLVNRQLRVDVREARTEDGPPVAVDQVETLQPVLPGKQQQDRDDKQAEVGLDTAILEPLPPVETVHQHGADQGKDESRKQQTAYGLPDRKREHEEPDVPVEDRIRQPELHL